MVHVEEHPRAVSGREKLFRRKLHHQQPPASRPTGRFCGSRSTCSSATRPADPVVASILGEAADFFKVDEISLVTLAPAAAWGVSETSEFLSTVATRRLCYSAARAIGVNSQRSPGAIQRHTPLTLLFRVVRPSPPGAACAFVLAQAVHSARCGRDSDFCRGIYPCRHETIKLPSDLFSKTSKILSTECTGSSARLYLTGLPTTDLLKISAFKGATGWEVGFLNPDRTPCTIS